MTRPPTKIFLRGPGERMIDASSRLWHLLLTASGDTTNGGTNAGTKLNRSRGRVRASGRSYDCISPSLVVQLRQLARRGRVAPEVGFSPAANLGLKRGRWRRWT